MDFFISSAFADGGAEQANSPAFSIGLIVFMVIFFYFMMIRPQKKRAKAHRDLMSSISKGDEVLTNGGLIGKVVKVNENGFVEISLNENNHVMIKRDFITAVLPKDTMKNI